MCTEMGTKQRLASLLITKTCLYTIDHLKPEFYIVKLGFTGVYIIVFISAKKHRLWVLVRTARRFLTSTRNLCFERKYEKKSAFFLSENFLVLEVKCSIYLNRRVFVLSGHCVLSLASKAFFLSGQG